jgi:uncharacterized protein YpmB
MRKFISFLAITTILAFIIILIIELIISFYEKEIKQKQETEHYSEEELIIYEKLVEL